MLASLQLIGTLGVFARLYHQGVVERRCASHQGACTTPSLQPLPPFVGSRVSGKSTNNVASDMKYTLVSAQVIARHLLAKEKLMKDLKPITLEDH